MPTDIYNKEFQNWLKGALGLKRTKATLCEYISKTLKTKLKDFSLLELRQFFRCLKENEISVLLRTEERGVRRWECRHRSCFFLMKYFTRNHTKEHELKYTWTQHHAYCSFLNDGNEVEDCEWKVIRLYMHADNEKSVEKFQSLGHLDISHIIKVFRNCKLISPDGLAEPLDEVLEWRNRLMHSQKNMMTEGEILDLLKWTRTLLNGLGIGETTYYKNAAKELQDLADKDYFVKYQSEDCNQIIAKVLKAKDIADDLDEYIEDDNQQCKSKNKRLQALLGNISGVRSTTTKRMEINQADYKQIARESLQKKHEALILDKTEYNEDSDEYKELEGLRKRTEQNIQEVEASMQRLKAEEMAEEIVKLRNEVETLTEETKKTRKEDQQRRKTFTHGEKDSPPETMFPLNNMDIFQHPMCLISEEMTHSQTQDEIHLRCNQKALEQIEKINGPIVVLAVVGWHNTDKSHLTNHLGFGTIKSPNKGIWVMCKMHREQSNTVLMILDVKGHSDSEEDDPSYDNKIFTLATLLCNCLINNMEGAFDDDAAAKLTFVTEMEENIRFRGRSLKDNLASSLILPDFVLCLKDFNLMLSKENKYLEQCLAENKSKAGNIYEPRDCIRKYFPKRECFAFPVLHTLDPPERKDPLNIDLDHPITNFSSTMCRFVSHIYSLSPKTLLASKPVNGKMFVALADHYVTAIEKYEVIEVNDAFKAVAKNENAKVEKEAVEKYVQQLRKIRLPVSEDVLLQTHANAQQIALEYLRKNVVHDKESKYERQAQMIMDSVWNGIKYDNVDKIRDVCAKKIQDAFEIHVGDEIENKYYEKAGGFLKFQRDFECLKEEYERSVYGFKREEILRTWYGFVIRMKETMIRIVETDEDLSQKEKEDQKRRWQQESDKLIYEHKQAHMESQYEQTKLLQTHYRILKSNRREQLEIERLSFETLVHERLDDNIETAIGEIEEYTMAQGRRMQILETESVCKEVARAYLDQYTRKQDERFQRFESNILKQVKEDMRLHFERYELELRSKMKEFEQEKQKLSMMFEELKHYKSEHNYIRSTVKRFENEIRVMDANLALYKMNQESKMREFENGLKERVRSILEENKKEQSIDTRADPYAAINHYRRRSAFRRPEKEKEKETM